MYEFWGYVDMYGCLLVEFNDDEVDFGIFFLYNEGYSIMCGYVIIVIVKLVVFMNWVDV